MWQVKLVLFFKTLKNLLCWYLSQSQKWIIYISLLSVKLVQLFIWLDPFFHENACLASPIINNYMNKFSRLYMHKEQRRNYLLGLLV